jgi:hypothetical protein
VSSGVVAGNEYGDESLGTEIRPSFLPDPKANRDGGKICYPLLNHNIHQLVGHNDHLAHRFSIDITLYAPR